MDGNSGVVTLCVFTFLIQALYLTPLSQTRGRLAPTWRPSTLPLFHRTRFHGNAKHILSCHIQDIVENVTAFDHFFDSSRKLWFLKHTLTVPWEQSLSDPQIGQMKMLTQLQILGVTLPFPSFTLEITSMGPSLITIVCHMPLGSVMIVESVTPIGQLLQQVEHTLYAHWCVPRFVAKLVLNAYLAQFERHVPIWSSKNRLSDSTVLKEDGHVTKFRRFFKQFYSAKGTKKRQTLDW